MGELSELPEDMYHELRNTRAGRRLKREQAEDALDIAERIVTHFQLGAWPAEGEHLVQVLAQLAFSLRLVLEYAK